MKDSHQRGDGSPSGRKLWAERGSESPHDQQLRPFERQLLEALEDELLASSRAAGAPTPEERSALDGYVAQMRANPAGARGQAPLVSAATSARSILEAAPTGRVGWSPRWAVAAVAASLLFAFTWTRRAEPVAQRLDDVYLGAAPGGATEALSTLQPLPAELTWDTGGEAGVVRLEVFDLEGDPLTPVHRELTAASVWTPPRGLPRHGRVRVDRAADDGFGRVEVLCVDYSSR